MGTGSDEGGDVGVDVEEGRDGPVMVESRRARLLLPVPTYTCDI